jgi:hypothetical protein
METQTASSPIVSTTPNPSAVVDVKALVSDVKASDQTDPAKEAASDKPAEAKDSVSSKFAALARKQKAIEAEKAAIKAERERILAEKAELDKWKQEREQPKKKLSPLEALQEYGYTIAEANEFFLNDGKDTPELKLKEIEEKVESRLERMEREQKERDEKIKLEAEQRQKQIEEQAITEFKAQINTYLDENKDQFELTALFGAQDAVFDTVEEYFKANGKVLSVKEAAELVEKYLEDELDKVTKTKKYQSKYAQVKEQAQAADKSSVTTKTLANTLTTAPSSVSTAAKTEEERRRRALEILERQ